MYRTLALVIALAVSSSAFGAEAAAPCRDAKGKFIKCPAASASVRCKDTKGKFVKCGSPGAHPVA
jgi:hypothetical protein